MSMTIYCLCGAKMRVSAPGRVAEKVIRLFWQTHDGSGHGSCNAKACDQNRRNAEKLGTEFDKLRRMGYTRGED